MPEQTSHPTGWRGNDPERLSNSVWAVSRGNQLINCELVMRGGGDAVVRCGYGSESIIRSQILGSAEAALAVAEIWKAALLAQGFRIESDSKKGN